MNRLISILIIAFMLSGCGYNDIQTYDEQANAAWSEVLNQYQRRADLIPNIVSSVKGYASHEKEVLEAVTLARAQANRACDELSVAPNDSQKLTGWQQSQTQLSRAMGQITVLSERYPDLKAQTLYQDLMVQLEGTENRIAVARGRYIQAISQYNLTIRKFPAVMTAKVMNYSPRTNYLPQDVSAISNAPVVDFSSIPKIIRVAGRRQVNESR